VLRLPFRLTPRSAIEFSTGALLALVGLIFLLGTRDEYRAGRAFDQAMDSYAAAVLEDVHDGLDDAMHAKPSYDAPQEAVAKLLVDDGKPAEAAQMYERLRRRQEAAGGKASLPVLIGLAVANLEAVRVGQPSPEALREALREARSRLEAALAAHPGAGDAHVNLAAVALLEDDLARCRAELGKVMVVGNISPDALSILYNLNGLAALREQRYEAAAAEFEKVKEFRADWETPKLNLAAAHARMLIAPRANPQVALRAAMSLRRVLPDIRKSKSPLYSLICQALGTYSLLIHSQQPQATEALRYFAEAEKLGRLPWQSRFNQAIGQYLDVRAARRRNVAAYATPAAELARALVYPKASLRDRVVASCLLGTIEGERGNRKEAVAHFERAAALAAEAADPAARSAAVRVALSLIALYYEAGELPRVIRLLDQAAEIAGPEEKKKLDALSKQLRAAPVISRFECKQEKLFTDCDLRVSATVLTPGSPTPLTAENVALTLIEEASGTSKPLPFQLNGSAVYAVAVNAPQGKYRAKLVLSDPLGNRTEATSEPVELDRDPPQISKRVPDAGATVASFNAIQFTVEDRLSDVDLASLRVMLRYPAGSPLASRTLVSGGKVQYASADGSIPRYSDVTTNVRAPIPNDRLLKGEYRVLVHAQDTRGKGRDIEWSFQLAP